VTFKRSALVWENQKLPRIDPWDGQRTGGGGPGPRPGAGGGGGPGPRAVVDPWDGQRTGGGGVSPRAAVDPWRKTEPDKSAARQARPPFLYRFYQRNVNSQKTLKKIFAPYKFPAKGIFDNV
jgi:hypothetical protein